jgi:hypothetical protein
MSPYTTRRFTREKAIEIIRSVLDDPSTSNEVLGDMLDVPLRPQLYNALVVPSYMMDDHEQDFS